jgi:hypothetical protein
MARTARKISGKIKDKKGGSGLEKESGGNDGNGGGERQLTGEDAALEPSVVSPPKSHGRPVRTRSATQSQALQQVLAPKKAHSKASLKSPAKGATALQKERKLAPLSNAANAQQRRRKETGCSTLLLGNEVESLDKEGAKEAGTVLLKLTRQKSSKSSKSTAFNESAPPKVSTLPSTDPLERVPRKKNPLEKCQDKAMAAEKECTHRKSQFSQFNEATNKKLRKGDEYEEPHLHIQPPFNDPLDPVYGVGPAIPMIVVPPIKQDGLVVLRFASQNECIEAFNQDTRKPMLEELECNLFEEALNGGIPASPDTPRWFLTYFKTVESFVDSGEAGLDKAIKEHNKNHPDHPVDEEYHSFLRYFQIWAEKQLAWGPYYGMSYIKIDWCDWRDAVQKFRHSDLVSRQNIVVNLDHKMVHKRELTERQTKDWYPWFPTRALLPDPNVEYWFPPREPLACPDCIGPKVQSPGGATPKDDPDDPDDQEKVFNSRKEIKSFNRAKIEMFNAERRTRIAAINERRAKCVLRDFGLPEDAIKHLLPHFGRLMLDSIVFSPEEELQHYEGEMITSQSLEHVEYFVQWIESQLVEGQDRLDWTLWPKHFAHFQARDKKEQRHQRDHTLSNSANSQGGRRKEKGQHSMPSLRNAVDSSDEGSTKEAGMVSLKSPQQKSSKSSNPTVFNESAPKVTTLPSTDPLGRVPRKKSPWEKCQDKATVAAAGRSPWEKCHDKARAAAKECTHRNIQFNLAKRNDRYEEEEVAIVRERDLRSFTKRQLYCSKVPMTPRLRLQVRPWFDDPLDPVYGVGPAVPLIEVNPQKPNMFRLLPRITSDSFNKYTRQPLLEELERNHFEEALKGGIPTSIDTPRWFLKYFKTVESFVDSWDDGLDKAIKEYNKNHRVRPVDEDYHSFLRYFQIWAEKQLAWGPYYGMSHIKIDWCDWPDALEKFRHSDLVPRQNIVVNLDHKMVHKRELTEQETKDWYPWFPTRALLPDPNVEYWFPPREPLDCPDCIGPLVAAPSNVMPQDYPDDPDADDKVFNCRKEIKSFNRAKIEKFNAERRTLIAAVNERRAQCVLRDFGLPEDAIKHLMPHFRALMSDRAFFSPEKELQRYEGEMITSQSLEHVEYFVQWIESQLVEGQDRLDWTLWRDNFAHSQISDKAEPQPQQDNKEAVQDSSTTDSNKSERNSGSKAMKACIPKIGRTQAEILEVLEEYNATMAAFNPYIDIWIPPSPELLLAIDPVYHIGPAIPRIPLPEDHIITWEELDCMDSNNKRIEKWMEECWAVEYEEAEGRKIMTVLLDRIGGIHEKASVHLKSKGPSSDYWILIGARGVTNWVAEWNQQAPEDQQISACSLAYLLYFTQWAKESAAAGPHYEMDHCIVDWHDWTERAEKEHCTVDWHDWTERAKKELVLAPLAVVEAEQGAPSDCKGGPTLPEQQDSKKAVSELPGNKESKVPHLVSVPVLQSIPAHGKELLEMKPEQQALSKQRDKELEAVCKGPEESSHEIKIPPDRGSQPVEASSVTETNRALKKLPASINMQRLLNTPENFDLFDNEMRLRELLAWVLLIRKQEEGYTDPNMRCTFRALKRMVSRTALLYPVRNNWGSNRDRLYLLFSEVKRKTGVNPKDLPIWFDTFAELGYIVDRSAFIGYLLDRNGYPLRNLQNISHHHNGQRQHCKHACSSHDSHPVARTPVAHTNQTADTKVTHHQSLPTPRWTPPSLCQGPPTMGISDSPLPPVDTVNRVEKDCPVVADASIAHTKTAPATKVALDAGGPPKAQEARQMLLQRNQLSPPSKTGDSCPISAMDHVEEPPTRAETDNPLLLVDHDHNVSPVGNSDLKCIPTDSSDLSVFGGQVESDPGFGAPPSIDSQLGGVMPPDLR